MDVHALIVGTTSTWKAFFFIWCSLLLWLTDLTDEFSRLHCSPTWCILFLIMVQFDNLYIWEILSRLGCKLHEQDRPNSKVGSNEASKILLTRQFNQLSNFYSCKSSCPNYRCQSMLQSKTGMFISNFRDGEVNPHIRIQRQNPFLGGKDWNTC